LRIFDQSAHMPHLEERESYLAELRAFLTASENESVQHKGGAE
jgi:hypothetical protein